MLARFVAALLRRRNAATLVLVLLVLACAAGLARLRVDFSSQAFYGGERVLAARLTEHQAVWGADDDVLLVLVHTTPDDAAGVLEPRRLRALAELADALEQLEGVDSAFTIARLEVPRPALLRGEGETMPFLELVERAHLASMSDAARAPLLERMPFVPALLARDGRTSALVVELAFSSDDVMQTAALVAQLRDEVSGHELERVGLAWELAGVPAIRASFFELVVRDQARFVPLTLALIALSLFAVFRRVHAVLIPAIAAGVPTLMLLGVMGWTGEPIGLLNQAYFTLLPVIAVADAIHMVARVHEELALASPPLGAPSREQAIARAAQRVGLACLLTSLTTALGFASFALASMPILRSFGIYAAIGVALALGLVVIIVPLLLSHVPVERLRADTRDAWSDKLVRACVGLATRRPAWVLGATLVLGLAALPAAQRVEIDNRLVDLLDPSHPVAHASARVDRELGGSLGLELDIVLTDAEHVVDGSARDVELLERLAGFERWLAAQPEVRSVEGLAGWLVALEGRVPADAAELDAALERLARLLPLERFIAPGRTRIRAGVPELGGRAFVEFAARAEAELQRRLAGSDAQAHATGTVLLAYTGVNHITSDLRSSFALVFAVIGLLIALVFRGLGPALLAMPVNALPLLLGYALLGVLGIVLDPLAAVILTLALGIAVDDTLHVMVRVREELGARTKPTRAERVEALARAMRHSGRAVVITSVVVAGGLAIDMLSSFPPLQLLGLLGVAVLLLALLANLLILPALIVVFGRR